MKRMKPDAYKTEARTRVQRATEDLVARHGVWNAGKIRKAMEDILRNERLLKGDKYDSDL